MLLKDKTTADRNNNCLYAMLKTKKTYTAFDISVMNSNKKDGL